MSRDSFIRGYLAGFEDAVAQLKGQIASIELKARPGAPSPTGKESPAAAMLRDLTQQGLSTHMSGPAPEQQPEPERGYAHCVRCQRRHRRPVAVGLLDPCYESLSEGSP